MTSPVQPCPPHLQPEFSTLIGRGMSRLCSNWLDLDHSFAKPALFYAIKTQLLGGFGCLEGQQFLGLVLDIEWRRLPPTSGHLLTGLFTVYERTVLACLYKPSFTIVQWAQSQSQLINNSQPVSPGLWTTDFYLMLMTNLSPCYLNNSDPRPWL